MTVVISPWLPETSLAVRKFTYRDLLAMERAGILQEDQHVELLGGQVIVMPVHPPHAPDETHQWLPDAILDLLDP